MLPHQSNETSLKRKFGESMNSSTFRKTLTGEMWDNRTLDVPLKEINRKTENYLISNCFWSAPAPPCNGQVETFTVELFGMVSHTFRFPTKKKITYAAFQFSTTVFDNGYSPDFYDLIIAFQYPNRLYRTQASFFAPKWSLENGTYPKNRRLKYMLKNMEVVRRRHKWGKDCTDIEDFDNMVRENIMLEVGCRPYYYDSKKVERICSTWREYKAIITKQNNVFYKIPGSAKIDPPCLEIQKLQLEESMQMVDMSWNDELLKLKKMDYRENETTNQYTGRSKTNSSWFEIRIKILTDTFKEIKQKRAYSTQSLVGNLGGYIGIFLGFTLFDLLNLIMSFNAKIRKSLN